MIDWLIDLLINSFFQSTVQSNNDD